MGREDSEKGKELNRQSWIQLLFKRNIITWKRQSSKITVDTDIAVRCRKRAYEGLRFSSREAIVV